MKTTLEISDVTMRRLKAESARQSRTMSDMVESALRALLESKPARARLPPLPSFHGGRAKVDLADRSALYDAME
jgi:hypothetical protein